LPFLLSITFTFNTIVTAIVINMVRCNEVSGHRRQRKGESKAGQDKDFGGGGEGGYFCVRCCRCSRARAQADGERRYGVRVDRMRSGASSCMGGGVLHPALKRICFHHHIPFLSRYFNAPALPLRHSLLQVLTGFYSSNFSCGNSSTVALYM
jgi:hypothetical protein